MTRAQREFGKESLTALKAETQRCPLLLLRLPFTAFDEQIHGKRVSGIFSNIFQFSSGGNQKQTLLVLKFFTWEGFSIKKYPWKML